MQGSNLICYLIAHIFIHMLVFSLSYATTTVHITTCYIFLLCFACCQTISLKRSQLLTKIAFFCYFQTTELGPPGVGPGANTSEGVLANFFNSLLSKKTGQPGSPGTQVKSAAGNDDCKYIFYPMGRIQN